MTRIDAAFDTHQAVTAAVDTLLQFGFPRSAIRYDADDRFRSPPDGVQRDTGLLSTVTTFFAKVSGSDSEPHAAAYADILRRGGMIVSVEADTAVEEQTARTLFRQAGAVDTDIRPPLSEPEWRTESLPDKSPDALQGYAEPRKVLVGTLPVYSCPARAVALDLPRPSGMVEGDWRSRGDEATETDLEAFRPGTFEIRQRVETVSVIKHARVIEELRVDKSVVVYSEEITATLRATVVDIDQRPADAASTA